MGGSRAIAGHSYFWLDASALGPGALGLKYWLEDIDLKGKRNWHGPVTPVHSTDPLPEKAQAVLLSSLNRERAKQEPDLSSRETLQGRLHKDQSPLSSRHKPETPSVMPSLSRGNIMVRGLDDGKGTFQGPLPRRIPSDKPHLPAAEAQQALAGTSSIKLFIQKEGWYRVTQPELLAAGLDPNVNPRYLQLFVDGKEQPILVTGEGRQLGPQGAVEFYGRGLDTCWMASYFDLIFLIKLNG